MVYFRKKRDSKSNRWGDTFELPLTNEEFVHQREVASEAIENFLEKFPQWKDFLPQTNDIVREALKEKNLKVLTGSDLMIQLVALVGPCQIQEEDKWKTLPPVGIS